MNLACSCSSRRLRSLADACGDCDRGGGIYYKLQVTVQTSYHRAYIYSCPAHDLHKLLISIHSEVRGRCANVLNIYFGVDFKCSGGECSSALPAPPNRSPPPLATSPAAGHQWWAKVRAGVLAQMRSFRLALMRHTRSCAHQCSQLGQARPAQAGQSSWSQEQGGQQGGSSAEGRSEESTELLTNSINSTYNRSNNYNQIVLTSYSASCLIGATWPAQLLRECA